MNSACGKTRRPSWTKLVAPWPASFCALMYRAVEKLQYLPWLEEQHWPLVLQLYQVSSTSQRIKTNRAAKTNKVSGWILNTCVDQLAEVLHDIFDNRLQSTAHHAVWSWTQGHHKAVCSALLSLRIIIFCYTLFKKWSLQTTIVGLILNNNETHYREQIQHLIKPCLTNSLDLKTSKIKFSVVEFWRFRGMKHVSIRIHGEEVDPTVQISF